MSHDKILLQGGSVCDSHWSAMTAPSQRDRAVAADQYDVHHPKILSVKDYLEFVLHGYAW